ncbi:MAG: TIGR00341 family protein [Hyphomonadaceae bacterium]
MAARLVMVFAPDSETALAGEIARRYARRVWVRPVQGATESVLCVVQGRYLERLLKEFDAAFSAIDTFNVIVLPIEALVPPLRETIESSLPIDQRQRPQSRLEAFFSRDRLSTDELYEDIEDNVRLSPSFVFTALASALIAGLGMRSGQTAIVIGAMVIAPFLGPSIGMAMAGTLGDHRLGRRAATTVAVGAVLTVILMSIIGRVIEIDLAAQELLNRTVISPGDLVLALASGATGVLAFSRGTALSLVGVMIAVALVPPLSATGLLLGAGHPELALRAFLLFGANLVCINVAGIATFLAQGLPPKSWRITGGILAVWVVLLGLLGAIVGARFGDF